MKCKEVNCTWKKTLDNVTWIQEDSDKYFCHPGGIIDIGKAEECECHRDYRISIETVTKIEELVRDSSCNVCKTALGIIEKANVL